MKPLCPKCGSNNIIYNGYNATGKQRYKCKNCSKLYVENPSRPKISEEKKETIEKLMVERITLAGIARATGVSPTWLQNYAKYCGDRSETSAGKLWNLLPEAYKKWGVGHTRISLLLMLLPSLKTG